MEALTGSTPDISPFFRFQWWEPVYYKLDDSDFPSESRELPGHFVGIAEHVGHAMTYKVLTDDTSKVLYQSNLRSALDPSAPNLRLDLPDGETPKPFIKSRHDSDDGEIKKFEMPIVDPEELVGRTFLLEPCEDGQKLRAHIVEAIEDHQNATEAQPTHIKFLLSVNDDQFEEVMAYNDVMAHIERDNENAVV